MQKVKGNQREQGTWSKAVVFVFSWEFSFDLRAHAYRTHVVFGACFLCLMFSRRPCDYSKRLFRLAFVPWSSACFMHVSPAETSGVNRIEC